VRGALEQQVADGLQQNLVSQEADDHVPEWHPDDVGIRVQGQIHVVRIEQENKAPLVVAVQRHRRRAQVPLALEQENLLRQVEEALVFRSGAVSSGRNLDLRQVSVETLRPHVESDDQLLKRSHGNGARSVQRHARDFPLLRSEDRPSR